jgi:hypothetical protein
MKNTGRIFSISLPLFLAGILRATPGASPDTTLVVTDFEVRNAKEAPDQVLKFKLETEGGKNIFTVQIGNQTKQGYWEKSPIFPPHKIIGTTLLL